MKEYLFILGNASELACEEIKTVLQKKQTPFKINFFSPPILSIEAQDIASEKLISCLGGTVKIAKVEEKTIQTEKISLAKKLTHLLLPQHQPRLSGTRRGFASDFCKKPPRRLRGEGSLLSAYAENHGFYPGMNAPNLSASADEIRRNRMKPRALPVEISSKNDRGKITFGISGYGKFGLDFIFWLSKQIKKDLKQKGFKSRFVLPQKGQVLSSVVVAKQKAKEINLVRTEKEIIIAETLVVQDFEDWGKRDYGRPFADPKKGMLPPKVARMMVNLAMPAFNFPRSSFKLLDPFCGMGTILAEALILGVNVLGSDQSFEAIQKTEKNLDWLIKTYRLKGQYKLFIGDAARLDKKIAFESVNAIVTEPFMGPLFEEKPSKEKAEKVILGLEKLYTGCFKNWQKILVPRARVVIALPSFQTKTGEIFVKKVIDNCENLGYNLNAGPLPYARPQAVIKRNIYQFERKK